MNYSNDPTLERMIRLRKIRQMKKLRRRRRIVICILILLIIIMIASIGVLGKKLLNADTAYTVSTVDDDPKETDKGKKENIKEQASKEKEIKKEDKTKGKKKSEKSDEKESKGALISADYSSHYCYEADKQERYQSYHSSKPHLSVDEVVWQVNANLDKPFYGYDIPAGDINDPLVIVNKYYKVSSSQRPNLTTADGYQMTPATAEAYKRMKSDAAQNGLSIMAASTYRSVEYQKNLYNSYLNSDPREVVDTYSARAGYSEHHTGMAIDFIGSFGSLNDFEYTKEYPWVRDNCHKYGFIIRYTTENQWITGYKSEPWHLRYIGVEAATDMTQRGISSFEEYKVKFIDHRP